MLSFRIWPSSVDGHVPCSERYLVYRHEGTRLGRQPLQSGGGSVFSHGNAAVDG